MRVTNFDEEKFGTLCQNKYYNLQHRKKPTIINVNNLILMLWLSVFKL